MGINCEPIYAHPYIHTALLPTLSPPRPPPSQPWPRLHHPVILITPRSSPPHFSRRIPPEPATAPRARSMECTYVNPPPRCYAVCPTSHAENIKAPSLQCTASPTPRANRPPTHVTPKQPSTKDKPPHTGDNAPPLSDLVATTTPLPTPLSGTSSSLQLVPARSLRSSLLAQRDSAVSVTPPPAPALPGGCVRRA